RGVMAPRLLIIDEIGYLPLLFFTCLLMLMYAYISINFVVLGQLRVLTKEFLQITLLSCE
ncbi:hypothetical protein, partial [Escherichia coli]|uniref:hypothetical protein n=1 Tax=Escherichia coli TaxID=562 RepID=UPI001B8C448D